MLCSQVHKSKTSIAKKNPYPLQNNDGNCWLESKPILNACLGYISDEIHFLMVSYIKCELTVGQPDNSLYCRNPVDLCSDQKDVQHLFCAALLPQGGSLVQNKSGQTRENESVTAAVYFILLFFTELPSYKPVPFLWLFGSSGTGLCSVNNLTACASSNNKMIKLPDQYVP